MIVDTSAVLAVLLQEPDAGTIAQALETAARRLVSAVSVLEAAIVLTARKGGSGVQQLDLLLSVGGFEIVPFDAEQAFAAREAFERFGKGRHPAALNFGDCAVYALAATRAMPLLFKGNDFARTDIASVRTPG
ncbi:ribonuclease VapC [Tistlia consotensis]|uniref:Ribonuclease VapC n=1 Tax=Tistlia consotensis USBA 355 TaxID=560819 RepID=A0A1Y6BP96_9PROT|nr:type II toxin-antitoxin system VapC family toxin [Tistlia consotensis]SMF22207.1 ribonuclease VapC [Tistlia consotensis USBA 355]SNR46191.1 ribonuclease VapC [Tistlia consotensis]